MAVPTRFGAGSPPKPEAARGGLPSAFLAVAVATAASALLALPSPGAGQIVPIRTVPISQAHQFDVFPSHTSGMGGVAIAVRDSLHDPFRNPAAAARVAVPRVHGSPGLYGVSEDAGAGRTLPVAALTRQGPWFGAVSVALQKVDPSDRPTVPSVRPGTCPSCLREGLDPVRPERSHGNQYLFAAVGRDLGEGLALAGSVQWSGLEGVDGVDLLYAGSARVDQRGGAVDVRLGLLREWSDGRTLELVAVHNRFGMTHDVHYLDRFWDPGERRTARRPRTESNLDRTRTWGLHVEHQRPLEEEGWRIGWLGTANYKWHPKIPNYELMSIPRDPGHSGAFQLGVGLARTRGATFGVDLVWEPIWSYTWADAAGPVEDARGDTIPAGGKTVENRFRFSNAVFRTGLSEDVRLEELDASAGLQLGLEVRRVRYRLAQRDNVLQSDRRLVESWVEWTPTWGLGFGRPDWEIRYRGRVTHGTGRPGVAGRGGRCFDVCLTGPATLDAGGSNIVAAPSGPLTLDPVRVVVHQVSLSLPLR